MTVMCVLEDGSGWPCQHAKGEMKGLLERWWCRKCNAWRESSWTVAGG